GQRPIPTRAPGMRPPRFPYCRLTVPLSERRPAVRAEGDLHPAATAIRNADEPALLSRPPFKSQVKHASRGAVREPGAAGLEPAWHGARPLQARSPISVTRFLHDV